MLFNSIDFLIFLPIVFIIYWMLGKKYNLQNLFIVAASYVFYGWVNTKFLLLISFTTLCSWLSGLYIEKYRANRRLSKSIAGLNIVINILILILFKYYNFFAESFATIMQSFGIKMNIVELNLILPIGISFYTFQALSYSIDVYKGKLKATKNAAAFFAYISFFPQLVAGPIERATNLLPQFLKRRTFDYTKAVDGLRQMLWGFFMKIVVADNCALGVDNIFTEYSHLGATTLIYGVFLFSIQIYCDFAGYSNIAIGAARLFGIDLMRNFNNPYFSRDISEFWRRWHISLTTWFRDYIYIPLGGSRCGKAKGFRNTLVIFLVSGLWHGANWTYVVWGLYHAVLFLPLLLTGRNRKYIGIVAENKKLPSLKETLQMSTTFLLIMIGWIIFRADTIHIAWEYIVRMFTAWDSSMPEYGKSAFIWTLIMLIVEWIQRDKPHALSIETTVKSPAARMAVYYAIIITIILFQGETEQFIYFRF